MNKDEADLLVAEWEGKKPPSLELFLEYLDMTEDEFNEIVSKLVVPPFQPDFKVIQWGRKTQDFDTWYRERKS